MLDPERHAVRLDRRHDASAVALTPPDVRNVWTVGYIRNLQGGVVGRWRGDAGTSYASPPVVCVASNAGDCSEMDDWRCENSSGPCPQGNDHRAAALRPWLE
ncbi:hypothetical protein GCM10010169_22380 [Micromonospora fulviviridis]|nr:hypothetical protein GCM10010169_22380 [Micromonospora fulviviridis]